MAEFEYPDNAWLGTSVDLQARVANAEKAFANVKATVKWLSIEPLIEPLHFKDLSCFQWVVIGGASPSTQTPEWRPPRSWVWDLTIKAQQAGCAVYHKANLRERLVDVPGGHIEMEPRRAPDAFQYLKVILCDSPSISERGPGRRPVFRPLRHKGQASRRPPRHGTAHALLVLRLPGRGATRVTSGLSATAAGPKVAVAGDRQDRGIGLERYTYVRIKPWRKRNGRRRKRWLC